MMSRQLPFMVCIGAALATVSFAQTVPLHIGTTNSVADEFGNTLKGTGPGVEYFGFTRVTGEVVQILQVDNGVFPPNIDGTPDANNPVVAELGVGDGVDPSAGPSGKFGGSLAQRPSGKIIARVFNKSSLAESSFYADSQVFEVPTTNYDVFIPEVSATTQPIDPNDNDGDGLNNSWEKSLHTNPNNPDTDGDGMSDGAEIRAGTNPTDPNSMLAMVELRPSGGNDLEIVWDAVSGKKYQVECTIDDLRNNPVYTNVSGVIVSTGSVSSTVITNGTLNQGAHYRVRLVEP